ncbi:PH domain leucine-rich repeat-containing protein phosphatase 1-like isoform 2-T2 [Erethizon dorsatum]
MASTYLRPVLCTLDTTAGEVAARLLQLGHKGGGVVKVLGQGPGPTAARSRLAPPECRDSGAVRGAPRAPPADLPLPRLDSSPRERRPGGAASPAGSPRRLDGAASDAESFSLSPSAESVSDRLDPYSGGSASSSEEELEADPGQPRRSGRAVQSRPPSPTASPPRPQQKASGGVDSPDWAAREGPREEKAAAAAPGPPPSTPGRNRATLEKGPLPPTLYVQLHGETTRRLEADEKPLQIQNDYLFQLGFGELWRVQEEGMDSEIGCLIRFYAVAQTGLNF